MIPRISFAVLAVFLLASAGRGQAPAGAPAKAAQAPQPDAQTKTAQTPASPATDFSQEAYVFEEIHTTARFEDDGTAQQETYIRVRLQSPAALQTFGQLKFSFGAANDRLDIKFVRVRKADGTIVTAGPDAVQELSAPVARLAPVYSDLREKHVTVPALAPGEVLEYDAIRKTVTPLAPGQFWEDWDPTTSGIVLHEQFELDVPGTRAVKLKYKPEFVPVVTDAGNRRIYHWSTSHMVHDDADTGTDHGKDKVKKKTKAERDAAELSAVQLTTFSTWDEVGRWYAGLERDRRIPAKEVQDKAAELISGQTTDTGKIEALYDFVSSHIRYVSLSFGVGRYQPHAASEVLANQYGDCKDKTTLLNALLTAAGFQGDAVLINSSRKIDPDVPSPAQFDHAINFVALGDQEIWLDSTAEVAPFRMLSKTLRDKKALVVKPAGPSFLKNTPETIPFPSSDIFELAGKVDDLGKLDGRISLSERGDAELGLRADFRRLPKSSWPQVATALARKLTEHDNAEGSDFHVSDAASTREPFQLDFKVSIPGFLSWSEKKFNVELTAPMSLPSAGSDDDDDPIDLGAVGEFKSTVKLELPATLNVHLPVPVSLDRDYMAYRSVYQLTDHTVTAERRLELRKSKVPSAHRDDYEAFGRALQADVAQKLVLENNSDGTPKPPADAEVADLFAAGEAAIHTGNFANAVSLLESVVAKDPRYKGAWTELGRAYLGSSKYDKAVEAMHKAIELNPYDPEANDNLGLALQLQGRNDQAIQAFQKQIEISPLDYYAHASLGELYLRLKKYDLAVKDLEIAVSVNPDVPAMKVDLGRGYLNLDQTDKAMEIFQQAVEKQPDAFLWNNIAYELAVHKTHLDLARRYAESAVASNAAQLRNASLEHLTLKDLGLVSSLGASWDTLGWVYFQADDLQRAEKFVRAAWELQESGEEGDHLGQIYEKLGRKDDAIRQYKLALHASRPPEETRGRLTALLGSEKRIENLTSDAGEQLAARRTIKFANPQKLEADAQFFVLLSPDDSAEDVKFVSGDQKLSSFAMQLRAAAYPQFFPDATPSKIIRRGILSCSPFTKACAFVLIPPENVRSLD